MMEIRHLVTFITIVEHEGFTKAAEHLGYAQSTITLHIKALEEEINYPLFDRIGKRVILTETGKKLLPHAKKMLDLYHMIKEVTAAQGELTGNIVISIGETLLIYRFPPIIEEFKKLHPHVNIEWHQLDSVHYKENLMQGKSDISFMLGTEVHDPNLYSEKLAEEPMMLLYPNSFELQRDIVRSNLLFTERGCGYRTLFEQCIEEYQIGITSNIEFWSIEAVKQSILSGMGISLLPRITVEKELKEEKLSGQQYKQNLATQLLYPKNKWISPQVEAFIEIVRKHASLW
ncbi:LysR family transcriptional regulator [Paenibacillus polymyxa]|uniref:LysR family transcriptional regulator n=2 Tax=Paenibacillus TaxID=44249 RepID=UPI000B89BB39|nr:MULTISPECIES: LysR family transcriptional regulator [Paenibacillus]MCF7754268.1 LysR family transcriptional regulator [Paenibacillus xylanexedens]MCL6658441.1 LysR family transcriptional regulator [Paenibacillus amylolyticus]